MNIKFEKEEIFRNNQKIDKILIAEVEKLEKELSESGLKRKSEYSLTHPLNTATKCFDR